MEKLIELLNEHLKTFDTETNKTNKVYAFENATKSFIAENGTSYRQERVISKRFKFIKWLVDNDKIDRKHIPTGFDYQYQGKEDIYCVSYELNILTMRLSIQDDPVEFLVSILK